MTLVGGAGCGARASGFVSRAPGRPRATVRSNYVGLPSMAGRGRTNAGGSPRDQGGEEPAVRPRKRGPEDTNRRGGAPKGDALSAEGAPAEARDVRKGLASEGGGTTRLRLSALRSRSLYVFDI